MAKQQMPSHSFFKPFSMIVGFLVSVVCLLSLAHFTGYYNVINHMVSWRFLTHLRGYSFEKLHYEKGLLHLEGLRILSHDSAIHDIFIKSLTIPSSYTDLWAGRFRKIEARGLSLFIKVAHLNLESGDHLLAEISPHLLNFTELDIKDSAITLISPFGPIELTGSFHKNPHTTKITLDVHTAQLLKQPIHIRILTTHDHQNLAFNCKIREQQTKHNILKAKGSLHLSERKGSMDIEGRAFPLSRIFDLAPLLIYGHSSLISFDANIALKGTLTWDGSWTSAHGPMTLQCTHGTLVTSLGKINNFKGAIHFSHLNPFVTSALQNVQAEQLMINSFPLTHAKLTFAFSPQGEFNPTRFFAHTLGGEINAYNFRSFKDLHDGPFCELDFKDIRLEELVAFLAINDLKINTTIQGHANLALEKETLQLQNMEFHAVTPQGHLQYFSAPPLPHRHPLQGDQLAFEVLRDLRFTRLEGKIYRDPQAAGEFKAEIKLAGFNPDVLQGYPFEFNLTATGALRELIQNTLRNLQSPKDLEAISRFLRKPGNKSS